MKVEKEVLQNINIEIENQKTTALVGLSGCGKSTVDVIEVYPIAVKWSYISE